MEDLPPLLKKKERTEQSTEPEQESVVPSDVRKGLVTDWSSSDVLHDPETMELIDTIVEKGHPQVIHTFLQRIQKRLYKDAVIWAMRGEVTELLELGDQIYAKRRR